MREVLLALALIAAAPAGAAAGPDAARQQALRHMLDHDCGSCHGLTRLGGLGPALTRDRLAGRRAQDLARVILDGVPDTPMPPWRTMLTEDDALWLAQYLLEAPAP